MLVVRVRIAWTFAVIFLAVVSTPLAHSQAADPAMLVLEDKIPLGHVAGRIDHLAIDLGHRRLFVAELGNNTDGIIAMLGETGCRKRRGNSRRAARTWAMQQVLTTLTSSRASRTAPSTKC